MLALATMLGWDKAVKQRGMSMENNNERSSMEIFEKDQKIAFVDSFSNAALSYEYEQAGFTINLMQRSVLLFNHNIKKT